MQHFLFNLIIRSPRTSFSSRLSCFPWTLNPPLSCPSLLFLHPLIFSLPSPLISFLSLLQHPPFWIFLPLTFPPPFASPSSFSQHIPLPRKIKQLLLMHLTDGQAQVQWSVALQLGLSWSPGNSVNEVYPSIKCEQSLSRRASQWGVSKGWRRIISAPFKASECLPGLNPSAAA